MNNLKIGNSSDIAERKIVIYPNDGENLIPVIKKMAELMRKTLIGLEEP